MASLAKSSILRQYKGIRPASRLILASRFHTSQRRSILPPSPQHVNGSVNTPAQVPETSPSHGSYHWTFERLLSVALVPVTVAPFAAGTMNPVMDATLAALILVHSHIGFQACITDYFPKWRVPKSRAAAEWALRIATLGVAVGLYEFETNDVGLTETIKRIWHA